MDTASWDEFLQYVDKQIIDYYRWATTHRILHIIARLWAAIGAIVAPVILSVPDNPGWGWAHWIGIAVSTSVAVALAADRIYAWGDRYRNCMLAWNTLKFETAAYRSCCSSYSSLSEAERRSLLFDRVHNVIDQEIRARVEALLTAEPLPAKKN